MWSAAKRRLLYDTVWTIAILTTSDRWDLIRRPTAFIQKLTFERRTCVQQPLPMFLGFHNCNFFAVPRYKRLGSYLLTALHLLFGALIYVISRELVSFQPRLLCWQLFTFHVLHFCQLFVEHCRRWAMRFFCLRVPFLRVVASRFLPASAMNYVFCWSTTVTWASFASYLLGFVSSLTNTESSIYWSIPLSIPWMVNWLLVGWWQLIGLHLGLEAGFLFRVAQATFFFARSIVLPYGIMANCAKSFFSALTVVRIRTFIPIENARRELRIICDENLWDTSPGAPSEAVFEDLMLFFM